jgi:hypothetical protein
MKLVLRETACDVCGKIFMGEFVQHDSPEDDYDWEEPSVFCKLWVEAGYDPADLSTYPHIHELPTVECHICPECRKVKNETLIQDVDSGNVYAFRDGRVKRLGAG